jgi:hypothetical protein
MMEEEEEDAESAVHKDHQQVPVDKASPVNVIMLMDVTTCFLF